MKFTTGSRAVVDGVNCVVLITDAKGNPITVKADPTGAVFEIRHGSVVQAIIQPELVLPTPKTKK